MIVYKFKINRVKVPSCYAFEALTAISINIEVFIVSSKINISDHNFYSSEPKVYMRLCNPNQMHYFCCFNWCLAAPVVIDFI